MGVTHLSIALCNYCVSKRKKTCAYLELHRRNEISQLITETHLLDCLRGHSYFRLHGVDFYPAVDIEDIPALLNLDYDYLILDAGAMNEGFFSEFLRCDRKLIVGSLAPWKSWKYEAFFQNNTNTLNLRKGFDYLVQTGVKTNVSSFARKHHINLQTVPFINNPFCLEKDIFPFLGILSSEL